MDCMVTHKKIAKTWPRVHGILGVLLTHINAHSEYLVVYSGGMYRN